MDLVKKIHKYSLITLIPVTGLSALIEWKKLPYSILIGGLLGLVNIKAMSWGVTGMLGTSKANAKMIFFSQFRFFVLTVILGALIYLKLVNVFGLLVGFTVVFIVVLIEGHRYAKNQ